MKSRNRSNTSGMRTISSDATGHFDPLLDNHFLANRELVKRKVENLLLSTSFGANSVLYAVFLGYLMGLWGLLVQFAWAASFYLLAPFARKIHRSTSLHEFLGNKFGNATRKLAALCSIVGITYFVGWEISVANSALESMTISHGIIKSLLALAIVVAILYSTRCGRKASGNVNVFLNTVKVICLLVLFVLMSISFFSQHGCWSSVLLPNIGDAILAVGIIGFITNIIFNLSWQFVDNSSWQSISSSKTADSHELKSSIRRAGLGTLITVNGIGTLLGAMLRGIQGIDSTNALGQIAHAVPFSQLAGVVMVIMIILSAISLFDGAVLSISQSLVVDLGLKAKNKLISLGFARLITLIVGLLSAWGVEKIISVLGGSIFDMVYLVILTQLSLVGPVLVGLLASRTLKHMWIAILISLLAALWTTVFGTVRNDQILLQLAGTIVSGTSIATAYIVYLLGKFTKA